MVTHLVGVDTGGTFTDIVVLQKGALRVHKVLSTPDDPSKAILRGLNDLGIFDELRVLIHGSTVATNAVLERKGAVTGLITTAGFRDVLEIGRQTRPEIYNLRVQKQPPLVPRSLRVEVIERLNERGEEILPLDQMTLEQALRTLHAAGVESVAISLLFSFANPTHEQAVADAARKAGYFVSASSEVVPEFREYERTSTTVLNAYVGPLMSRYLASLEEKLPSGITFRIMQSNGGSISCTTARKEAARTLLSGPAAGVVGAAYVARLSGFQKAISFDIGGTSTDVALIDGGINETTSGSVGGYPSKLPMIDIHTVGSGGGSIAWFDVGGALKVGPVSAGASPGPAAYGLGGTEATVTDANVVLGRLIPEAFLGGTMSLDVQRARNAVEKIALRLETTVEEAALGIIRVVNANMEAAIRVISVARGSDPRDCVLVAFGGAGPLHACELAAALGIPRVLIPTTPGVLSALGMLVADTLKDYVQTIMVPVEEAQQPIIDALASLEAQGHADLLREGIAEQDIVLERYLDMRYIGQSYELFVPFTGSIVEAVQRFHMAHEQRFGYCDPNERVQVVNVRLKARGKAHKPALESRKAQNTNEIQPFAYRTALFPSETGAMPFVVPIYERSVLAVDTELSGPAIIVQYDTTTVVPPAWRLRVDMTGNLLLEQMKEQ
ncbi:N-methylhydantoinase A [Thermosporothrix hazakensis]|jgi:N-methylhydantoinase A|uniref:N-methylhydantoinase A n=1 Tax=Thermosporothrix hazakensis TaxID=644383 RepID=A0A326UCW9_THEHA|nr:hydantoinase/oxoprolinase family protein [Thermosporothrix hazakensis]PZW32129.1 N-methylhydantoinase A [Thermosporothrix hazakensis]GCE49543.1 N-methylhydantoinase A [Thermosporothrix hazakensis]